MLKILPIIPSSTSQKINDYSYFMLISLPINPMLFFFINFSGTYWHLGSKNLQFYCRYMVQILVIQVKHVQSMRVILALSYIYSSLMSLFAIDFNI